MILFLLVGCGAEAGDGPSTSTVSVVATFSMSVQLGEDGLISEDSCRVATEDSMVWDYSLCCPPGWVLLGLDAANGVVCGT